MGLGKTYSTKYLLDSNNNSGVAGQVLSTTSTGIDWADIGSIPTSGGTQFFNQSSLYNNTTPGITGYGNISIDSTSSYYDTGINVFTGIRGLVWTGKHYITIDHSGAVARFYDNNFSLIPNQEANTIALPVAANGAVQPHGGGWDGRYLWVLGLTPVTIIAYDLDNGTTTATIVSETDISSYSTTTYGIEYAEGHLYTCADGKVSMFKVEGKTVTHVFTSGVILGTIGAQAITYDGSYLWFTQNGQNAYKVSLDCALVATITTGLPPNNIGWAWNGQNIAAINYSTGDVNIINTAITRFDTEKFLVMGGDVGIGVTAPAEKLDVVSAIRIQAQSGGTNNATLVLTARNGGAYGNSLIARSDIQSTTDGTAYGSNLLFKTNNTSNAVTEAMRILANGNVGIMVTNPQGILSLKNQIANSGTPLTYSTVQQNVLNGYYTTGESPNRYMRYFDIACVGDGDGTNGGGNIRFLTNPIANDTAVERMRIDSAGKVGIGTTTPGAPLHVTTNTDLGDALILEFAGTSQGGPYQTFQYNEGAYAPSESGDLIGGIRARAAYAAGTYAGYSTAIEFRNDAAISSTSAPGRIEFYTTPAASVTPVERMRIASDGDVTIQTSGADDIKNFTINSSNGSSQVAGLIIQNDGANGYIHFKLGHGNATPTTKLTIGNAANSGNVGIGTTLPFSKLQVGSNTFTGANGMYNNSRVGISNHGVLTGMMLASTYDDALHPEYGLVFVQGPSTSSYNVWSLSPDGPAKGSGLCFNYEAQATNIHAPANTKVYFKGSTGSVGIGTTDPQLKLHVNGGGALFGDIPGGGSVYVSSVNGNTINGAYGLNSDTGDLWLNYRGYLDGHTKFRDTRIGNGKGNQIVLVDGSSGFVGIGVTSPDQPLEVLGTIKSTSTGAARLILNGDSNNSGDAGDIDGIIDMLHDGDPGSYGYRINTENYGGQTALHFQENIANAYTTRLYIDKDGDVGIGDSSPSYKLDVDGTIRATGDIIAYSDVRVKENIKTIDNSLEKVSKLRGVEFNKIGNNEKSIGVIAQEIEKVIPEVVRKDDKGMKSVAYGNISGLLIEAIKELKAEIDLLKSKPCSCNKCNCNI